MQFAFLATLAGLCFNCFLGSAFSRTLRAEAGIPDFDHLRKSVVRIQAVAKSFSWFKPFLPGGEGVGVGTGFVVQTEPYPLFVTNAHVVTDAEQVTLQLLLYGEHQFEARVVSICQKFDLALLVLHKPGEFKDEISKKKITLESLQLSSKHAPMGADVVALGFPLGQDALKISKGNIAGNEDVNGNMCIQSTAPISPGNSGGPLMNDDGSEVLGVNFAKSPGGENVNYVIPAFRVRQMVKKHQKDQSVMPTDGEWKRIQVRVPKFELTTAESNEALYSLSDGCDRGIYVSKIGDRSILKHAKPAAPEASFLVSVNGFELDRFGTGLNTEYFADRVPYKDLFFMAPELTSDVTFEICSKGETTKHAVSLDWNPDYERGIQYIDEPNFMGISKQYELFADISVMQMTENHISTIVQQFGMPGPARWLHPTLRSQPHLIVNFVRSGSYAHDILPIGAAVTKVNGYEVNTLEEFRDHFIPDDGKVWTLETDMGKFVAVMFKKTLTEQIVNAQRMMAPYLLTPGVMGAAKKLGLLEASGAENKEASSDDAEKKAPVAETGNDKSSDDNSSDDKSPWGFLWPWKWSDDSTKKQALLSAAAPTVKHAGAALPIMPAGPLEARRLEEDKPGRATATDALLSV